MSAASWRDAEAKQESARGPFERLCLGFLSLDGWGHGGLPVARRLNAALEAYRNYRDAHNQERSQGNGETILTIRVVADQLASDIAEVAGPDQDPSTVAWVLAGLRCPSRPFCTGCPACFTVTAPLRPTEPRRTR